MHSARSIRLCCVALLTLCAGSGYLARAQSPADQAVAQSSAALHTGALSQAEQITGAGLQVSPHDPRLLTLRGVEYAAAGDPRDALREFHAALQAQPGYLPALESAAQATYTDRDPEAAKLLEQILKQRPADRTAHAMRGALDFEGGRCEDAAAHFAQAGPVLDTEEQALFEYGTCLGVLHRYPASVVVLGKAHALAPSNLAVTYNLALGQWRAGDPRAALGTLEPALSASQPETNVLTLAAHLHESLGETQAAVTLLRRAIELRSDDLEPYLAFAELSYDHASYQVGIDMLDAGIRQKPQAAALYLYRGVLRCKLGETALGLDDFARADRLDPQLSFAGVAAGVAETQQHDLPKAIAAFRAQAEAHPEDPLTQYLLADALSQQPAPVGTPRAAELLRVAQRAVALDSTSLQAHDLLATIYLEEGKTALAVEQCNAALRIDANDQEAIYHLILADRRTHAADKIPALVKKLMEARNAQKSEQANSPLRSRLIEQVPGK